MEKEIYNKIVKKKEYSQLPKIDVELAWKKFENKQTIDEEKIKLTRELLMKVYGSFTSRKLLVMRDRDPEWILQKHISTRERLHFYNELYSRLLKDFNKEVCIFDLGSGVNGFSFNFIKEVNNKTKYIGIEGVGQLVNLTNYYFKSRGIEEAQVLHMSLFDLEKIKKLIYSVKEPKICFLFKVLDSLEILEKDYSKEFLREITNSCERVVISFAIKSLISRKRFRVSRNWLLNFIVENFNVLDDFELGNERYLFFEKKQ